MRSTRGTKAPRPHRSGGVPSGTTIPESVEDFPQRPVMIVDDDADILSTARLILQRHGFHVATRTTAPSWEDLQQVHPCVIFMDINLGPENGIAACQAIKHNQRFLDLPVILISGMETERLADAANQCQADGFLTKPYSAALLVKLAQHYAEQAERSLN